MYISHFRLLLKW